MSIRGAPMLILVAASRLAGADASPPQAGSDGAEVIALPPGTYRTQLELNFSVHDRGVGYHESNEYELAVDLMLPPAGPGTLKVRGTLEHKSMHLRPSDPHGTESRNFPVDDSLKVERSGRELRVRGLKPRQEQTFACARQRVPVDDKPTAVLWCRPTTRYTGLPWSDPLPHWLRVPLVFPVEGELRAEISASHESAPRVTLTAARRVP
jgi:hypothetical protein